MYECFDDVGCGFLVECSASKNVTRVIIDDPQDGDVQCACEGPVTVVQLPGFDGCLILLELEVLPARSII